MGVGGTGGGNTTKSNEWRAYGGLAAIVRARDLDFARFVFAGRARAIECKSQKADGNREGYRGEGMQSSGDGRRVAVGAEEEPIR